MKGPSIIFRVSRFIHFILNGLGKKEKEHFLFRLTWLMTDVELYTRLAACGWQPNYMGYAYRGQIYQCRRLLHKGKHQLHVRCYKNGTVTGHYEIAPEYDVSDHLAGVDLRTMRKEEANRLMDDIKGATELRRKFARR